MAVWQNARHGGPGANGSGWLGRAFDAAGSAGIGADAVFVGDRSLPRALFARRAVSTSFADAPDVTLALPAPAIKARAADPNAPRTTDLTSFVTRTVSDAYATAAALETTAARGDDASARYPASELAQRMSLVARSIKAGASARVYYVIQGSYDTHALQLPTQARLLREFSDALRAFFDDLPAAKLADRVVLLAFSEFGRRVEQNGSLGTDHGTAGPVFLAGPSVRAQLVGQTPTLGDLRDGDLAWSTDFRSVYATLLNQWLKLPADKVLGAHFDGLPVLKA